MDGRETRNSQVTKFEGFKNVSRPVSKRVSYIIWDNLRHGHSEYIVGMHTLTDITYVGSLALFYN